MGADLRAGRPEVAQRFEELFQCPRSQLGSERLRLPGDELAEKWEWVSAFAGLVVHVIADTQVMKVWSKFRAGNGHEELIVVE